MGGVNRAFAFCCLFTGSFVPIFCGKGAFFGSLPPDMTGGALVGGAIFASRDEGDCAAFFSFLTFPIFRSIESAGTGSALDFAAVGFFFVSVDFLAVNHFLIVLSARAWGDSCSSSWSSSSSPSTICRRRFTMAAGSL